MNKIYLSALALLASAAISAQISNPSFENWTAGEPDSWVTNQAFSSNGDVTDGSMTVEPSTEMTSGSTNGSSHIKLTSFNMANTTDATNFPNGDYGAYAIQTVATSDKFVDFTFDVMYDVAMNDTAIILVQAYNANGSLIGQGFETFAGIQANFATSTVTMQYLAGAVAEYDIFIASSEGEIFTTVNSTLTPGSVLEVDNITTGAVIPDAPNVTNVAANDVSDNGNGSDLEVSFDTPDETNVASYYVLAMESSVTPNMLNSPLGFLQGSGVQIATTGASQTYNFTAGGVYFRLNAAGTAVESAPIEENVEMIVYVLVEGATGYSSVFGESNPIILTSPVSVTDQYKEISIYPNPANNFVNFKIDGLENGTVIINSVTGQQVVNTTIANGMKKVDVSHLNNGVYIYTVRNQNNEVVKTNKLVVRK
ncbi:T9SS type A sorting domain-containing protein [Brumimicrobium mesophilum]|uniref:T9SS type A sorting domain-containing protein n=1 Tax=Brumimicrobium mesophilum TaxID=392717 RepID=UPI000D14113C|nr:T9SS type A sorting domain-containing protein [Brumimicrobium mesophilum]